VADLRTSRWAPLLEENEDFRRWYENLARGSEGTARERVRILYRFLRFHGLTCDGLVEMAKRDRKKVEDIVCDFVAKLGREGKSPGYIENYLKAIRSWLDYNEIRLVRKIKIGNRNVTPSIADERIPTKDELATIFFYASERAKCSISLIAFAGLRPEVLGNARGLDGLKVGDLPEMRVEGRKVVFTKVPTMVVVRPSLSKAGHRYFTFLASEGCDYLKAYLEKRLAMGEDLTPDAPLIAVTPGFERVCNRIRNTNSRHITTKNVTREIREAMRPRFGWRPYVLRAYFDTQLLLAENQGKISHAYRQFFMGHKGDIEARYTTNKGVLPPDMVEDMRKCYRECEPFLSTSVQPPEQSSIVKEAKVEALKSIAKSLLGIDLLEIKVAKEREVGRELGKDEELELFENELKKLREGRHNPQRIVREDELEGYLKEGWHFVSTLPSQRILIRKG
jgi:integrase